MLSHYLCNLRRRLVQYAVALAANIGMLSCGMHYGWPSISVARMTSGNYTFSMTDGEGSWLVSMLPIGSLIGTILAACFINIIGRKLLMLVAALPLAISWIILAMAPNSLYMFIGRFIGGVADGIVYTAVPPYLVEISDRKIRGFICSTYSLAQVFGILIINLLQYYLPIPTACYIAAAFSLLTLVVMPFFPETPYYLLMHKNVQAATLSLQKFKQCSNVTEDINRISEGLEAEYKSHNSLKDLFSNSYYRKILGMSFKIDMARQLCAASTITVYCTQLFQDSKDIIDPVIANIIYCSIFCIVPMVALVLVDISGRKILMITSLTLTAVSLFTNGVYLYLAHHRLVDASHMHYIPLACIIFYIITFSIGMQTVPSLTIVEILPTHIRGVGLMIVNFSFGFISPILTKYFTWSTDLDGAYVPFLTFGCCCIVSLCIIATVVPETKQKNLEDVQHEMRQRRQADVIDS